MTSIYKSYVPGPFGQIHCYAAGPDVGGRAAPCLIMAHQSPVCARMFEQAMPRLAAQGIHVVAVDTPGYGNSNLVPVVPGSRTSLRENQVGTDSMPM